MPLASLWGSGIPDLAAACPGDLPEDVERVGVTHLDVGVVFRAPHQPLPAAPRRGPPPARCGRRRGSGDPDARMAARSSTSALGRSALAAVVPLVAEPAGLVAGARMHQNRTELMDVAGPGAPSSPGSVSGNPPAPWRSGRIGDHGMAGKQLRRIDPRYGAPGPGCGTGRPGRHRACPRSGGRVVPSAYDPVVGHLVRRDPSPQQRRRSAAADAAWGDPGRSWPRLSIRSRMSEVEL